LPWGDTRHVATRMAWSVRVIIQRFFFYLDLETLRKTCGTVSLSTSVWRLRFATNAGDFEAFDVFTWLTVHF